MSSGIEHVSLILFAERRTPPTCYEYPLERAEPLDHVFKSDPISVYPT